MEDKCRMSIKGYSEIEWEIRDSRSGEKNLLLGGRSLYSSYDPIKHTDKVALELIRTASEEQCDHIIIIGLGLGYLPRSLYDAGFQNIIVWEPFPVMQESFSVCKGKWRESVEVVNEFPEFEEVILRFARKGSRPKLIMHKGYDIFCRHEIRLASITLDRIYNNSSDGQFIVSQRSLESMVRLPYLGTVKEFERAFNGKRAVIASSGPTLEKCINTLIGLEDIIVFASMQSASYLQKKGIKIDFIVCADPLDMTAFTDECNDDFKAVLSETSVDPASLDWKKEKTFLYHFRSGQIHEMLWEQAGLPIIEEPTSTVSEVMLLLADYMGFNEIYCAGVDYCWKDNKYTYRTKDVEDHDKEFDDVTYFQLLSSDNEIVTTQSLYYQGARFMKYKSSELSRKGKKVYQVDGGIEFAGANVLNADDFKRKLETGKDNQRVNIKMDLSPISIKQVEQLINDIKQGKVTGRQTDQNALKMWGFLREMPVEERPAFCERLLTELKLQKMSDDKIKAMKQ